VISILGKEAEPSYGSGFNAVVSTNNQPVLKQEKLETEQQQKWKKEKIGNQKYWTNFWLNTWDVPYPVEHFFQMTFKTVKLYTYCTLLHREKQLED
jgi:hypothetical protein